MRRRSPLPPLVATLALPLCCSLGCSLGCAPPPPAPKAKAPVVEQEDDTSNSPSFTSQVGGMNQEAVEKAFNRLQSDVIRCLEQGTTEGVGGSLTLELRIAMDGSTRWVHLADSDLGDRASERCVLGAARDRSWPKPKGGEGEISHTYTIEPAVAVKTWEAKRLRSAMPEIRKKVWKCFGGVRGRFVATLYIGRDGRVASAGAAPPSHEADAKVDCLVDELRHLEFGWQRARLSKVTFKLP